MTLENKIWHIQEVLEAFQDDFAVTLEQLAVISKDEAAVQLLRELQERIYNLQESIRAVTKYRIRKRRLRKDAEIDDEDDDEDDYSHVALENGQSIKFENQRFEK